MLVRMNGHQMVALELATRLYKRRMTGSELRQLGYHRKRFIEWMVGSTAVNLHNGKYEVMPGTCRIDFTIARLLMILDISKAAQRERIVVDKTLDQAVKLLENAHNEYSRTHST